jgi:ABC-2 type transport system ATP-binding protein
MDYAVEISHIDKNYNGLKALCDVDFTIEKGCFFGLLGPNGAGKSTLINIMAGLTHANRGSIRVMGYDVRKNWRQTRNIIGVVPQELAYDPFFTVREMLRLQLGYFGRDRSNYPWVDELMERLNLGEKAGANLMQLSGGMKRRVLIAQALVHKPKVVVLDEPTAGVDVELRKVLWEFIRHLHKNGHTILLTTHYLEEAESLCERIAILDKGRLIALDTTTALLDRYPYRLLHLTLKDPDDELPDSIKEKVDSFSGNELTLRLHCNTDPIGHILDVLHSENIAFSDLRTDEPRLEDAFIALTGKNHV